MNTIEIVLSILLGLMLSISAGFRIFVPLLMLSAVNFFTPNLLPLPQSLAWLGHPAALAVLGVATAAEIAAFYVPAVATFLSWVSTPLTLVAGALSMAAPMGALGDSNFHPVLQWTLAIVLGGGVATATNVSIASVRSVLAPITAGWSDVVITTLESIVSGVIALFWMICLFIGGFIALILVSGFLFFIAWSCVKLIGLYQRKKRLPCSP